MCNIKSRATFCFLAYLEIMGTIFGHITYIIEVKAEVGKNCHA
ncbi:hypothetical protein SAMN05878482_105329 [Peribacillus simplex]|uniref:Uncharacterized protein n=1 Tax=Peribacillus simplex TaxID=1478 RepID=A0A9X8RBG7_9BACI|nr:hypothetical protein SAMN05878482_105329 [Peribacillus simplex]